MKSVVKKIVIGVGLFIVLGWIVIVVYPGAGRFPGKARQSEAKGLLAFYYSVQADQHEEYKAYEKDLTKFSSQLPGEIRRYTLAPNTSEFQKLCPDCHLADTSYKLMVCGNIDDDPELDCWTIDDQKKIINVLSDL